MSRQARVASQIGATPCGVLALRGSSSARNRIGRTFRACSLLCIMCLLFLGGCGGMTGMGNGQSSEFGSTNPFDVGSALSTPRKAITSPLASSFWEMDKLRAEPKIEVAKETTEKSPTGDVICREIYYDSPGADGKSLRIFAYYAFPAAKKGMKLPGIVWVHGGAHLASKEAVVEWASRGYAAISMDLPGKGGPSREGSRSEGPDMTDQNIFAVSPSPRSSFLYAAVNSVCRAISVLCASAEVDPARIGIVGYSWGGVITLIANGIDNRISAACDVFGAGYIPQESCWLGITGKMPKKQLETWRQHFDPSSYLASQCGKTLFVGATQDTYYPLRAFIKTYEAAKCAKALCLVPNKNHETDDTANADIVRWFDYALRSGPALPVAKVAPSGDKIRVTASGARPVTAVSLVTADGADFTKAAWKWTDFAAKDNAWTAAAPKSTTPYFIAARDDGGALIVAEVRLPATRR